MLIGAQRTARLASPSSNKLRRPNIFHLLPHRSDMSSISKKRANDTGRGEVSPPPSKRAAKQISTTTKQAVSNFFQPASQKVAKAEKLSWRTVDSSLIIGKYIASEAGTGETSETPTKRKIAIFDFDSTLISTASKLKFAKDANDWCWWHGTVPSKLKTLHDDGYTIVIISNQNGISLRPPKNAPKIVKNDRFSQFKQKAGAVFNALNLPISLYAATERDKFRKPSTGIWDEFLRDHNLTKDDIDWEKSIFVGDAGGRPAGTFNGKVVKADFSCSDRNFAANIGMRFETPEEYFLGEASREFVRTIEPTSFVDGSDEAAVISIQFQPSASKEIILFVGFPGAGKSTFFRKYLQPSGYERVNQDLLKSREKCFKVAGESLLSGKSVAIDSTNPDRDGRKAWIALGVKHGVPIRCAHFTASKDLARHNDSVRALSGLSELNPEARAILPGLAFNSFASRYQEPKLGEGFSEIIQISFAFDGTPEERAVWSKYWY
ncbi:polynucleotide kinase 3 phosphatase [Microthyrium microscopicum]|uniref:Polynucleotide kinase 3 phosphatase n=1 Tax=Microthyrium microscopicum TaxID=703497 RepID=A0A6A6UQZ8_9PEZI|nr:polynucleotide kinase 3 phosphatase [Microthyrium microscopicum]